MSALHRIIAITSAALAVSTCCVAAAEAGSESSTAVVASGELRNLQPGTANPFGHARAVVVMVIHEGRNMAQLHVLGIDRAVAGRSFGAHLHVGPCVAGNGSAAGPHYNADVIAGRVPPRIDAQTEIWLDFTVGSGGSGWAITQVPFAPQPGDRAIVIHQEPTDPNGVAGPRLACLPVSW